MALLIATFIFIAKAYYDGCEDKKNTIYSLSLEIAECKEELKPYQEAEILHKDKDWWAIKVPKENDF